uniref:Putative GPI-anchored protein PB15E9.01c n=1 Tax=Monodelphis domestica TaxID=13616 RepID=A0A5F8H4W6_MONDO
MERQFLGTLMLLLLLLTLASETSGQDDQPMRQSPSPGTSLAATEKTSSLATVSTVNTTVGTADTQEARMTTSFSMAVTRTPSTTTMNSASKNQAGTTEATPSQHSEAARTTGRGMADEKTTPKVRAPSVASELVPTAGENINSSTTEMASAMVNGMTKATPAVATEGGVLAQPATTISSLLQTPEAAGSTTATMSRTPGGTGVPTVSLGTSSRAGTNGPVVSEANPMYTALTATRKDMETTKATPIISMTITEGLERATGFTPTSPKEAAANRETVNTARMSETKDRTTSPRKDGVSSVAAVSPQRTTPRAPTGSMELTANATVDTRHTASPKTTTLSTGSSGTNASSTTSASAMGSPCASDEYPSPTLERGCKCNSSYYAHPEFNNMTVALSCQPWGMEVSLSQCLLETLGWVQGDALFPGCAGVSKIVQGRRVITFLMKKKEGTCGLELSTNTSHALYFLKTQLPPAHSGSVASTGSTVINFTCAYPLVVNVSQKEPIKVVNSLHAKIHVPGTGDSIITLSIFTDAQYSSLLADQPVALNSPLYVVLEATNADPERFVLVANAFFASINASGASAPETTYYFVKHSCPVSERLLTKLNENGVSLKVKLAFRLFRFFTSDVLYFHSHMTLCDKKGNSSCRPSCTEMSEKPRNLTGLEHWNKDKGGQLMFGPVRLQDLDPSNNRAPAGSMRIWLTFLLLVVISGMLE